MDCVIDGVVCIQQRNDPVYGAQDLQTWSWGFQAIGGITASLVGGFCVQYAEARYSFLCYAMISLFGCLTALNLSPHMEDIEHQLSSMIE